MKSVKISVYREDPTTGEKGHFQEFDVPVKEGMVVLDAIRYIEENLDTTLSSRWNCKASRCGSCAAEINGRPALMCGTRIDSLHGNVRVEPMRAFPLIKDLVTDVSENFEIDRSIPAYKPEKGTKAPYDMKQIDIEKTKEFRKCIECFLCMDVCHVIRAHKSGYVGPRHVVKAASLDMHPKDTLDRSSHLNQKGGLGFCNITKCCQEVCPEGIRITDNAIIPEKERAVDSTYDPLMMFAKKVKEENEGKK